MAIKAVIFDCFGVLIAPAKDVLHHNFPQFEQQLLDLEKQSDLGSLDRPQFLQLVSELTGLSADDLGDKYYGVAHRIYNESAIDLLMQIKNDGKYKIGLLSNVGRGWLDNFLSEMGRSDIFDASIVSGDVGITKPSPQIFIMMAQRLGVEPSECVMIDDVLANIAGAKIAGMQGIVFSSTAQAKTELGQILKA